MIGSRTLLAFGVLLLAGGLVVAPFAACVLVREDPDYRGHEDFIQGGEFLLTGEGIHAWVVVCGVLVALVMVTGLGMIVGSVMLRNKARAAALARRR